MKSTLQPSAFAQDAVWMLHLFDSAHMLEAAIGMLGLGLWLGGCD